MPQPAGARFANHTLLRRLDGGLRSDVWLGLAPGTHGLDEVVLIKVFFPHATGPALDGLEHELALARRLGHENITRTLQVGSDGDRHFVVSEYLEGATLQALLLRASVAGTRMASAAVARVLLAVVRAVLHAERRAAMVPERLLANQFIAADDVFVTDDGAVKLLGFKTHLRATGGHVEGLPPEPSGVTSYAAIDALLSEHFSSGLRAVLAKANEAGVSRWDRLSHVALALQRWQTTELGSDGRAELAALMHTLFPTERLERRARLEAAFARSASARSASDPEHADVDEPPLSGIRAIARSAVRVGRRTTVRPKQHPGPTETECG